MAVRLWILGLPEEIIDGQKLSALLNFTDRATKMAHLVPTNKHETAEDTAMFFVHAVVRLHYHVQFIATVIRKRCQFSGKPFAP